MDDLASLAILLRFMLAIVLMVAAVSKSKARPAFEAELRDYRILPERAISFVSYAIPAIEAVVAAALIFTQSTQTLYAITLALFITFATLQGITLYRGIDLECGCFGGLTKTPISRGTLIRTIILAMIAAGLLSLSAPVHVDAFDAILLLLPAAGIAIAYLIYTTITAVPTHLMSK